MPYYASIAAAEADGLVHYWPMNESSGASVSDSISGWTGLVVGLDGTPTSSEINSSVVATPAGTGRDLGARFVSDPVKLMPVKLPIPAPSTAPLAKLTVRIRFYLNSQFQGGSSGWSPFGYGYSTGSAMITQYSSNTFWRIGTNSGNISGNPFTVGAWHDLFVSANATSTSFYLNGALLATIASGSNSFDLYRQSDPINGWIGADNDSIPSSPGIDNAADITVEDIAIWERDLSQTEIQSINSAGPSEQLTGIPPVEVDFDATVPYSAEFSAYIPTTAAFDIAVPYSAEFDIYTDSAYGFNVTAPFSATFDAYQDWTKALNSLLLQESYQLVITGSQNNMDDLIAKISSWQATNQSDGRQAFIQAVIPSANEIIDQISERPDGDLVIRKGLRLPSGESQFSEILRSNFDTLRYDRSGNRFTVTVSGYRVNETASTGSRTLQGIRTISVSNGIRRVRCDIDLFLRPGMTVSAADETFIASYINYFVAGNDKFCEVGER